MGPLIRDIKPRQSKFGQLGSALSAGVGSLLQHQQERDLRLKGEQQRRLEDESLRQMGIDLSGIQDPKIKELFIKDLMENKRLEKEYGFKSQEQEKKFEFEKKLADLKEQKGPSFKDQIALEDQKLVKERGQKAFDEMAELTSSLGRGSGLLGFFGGKTAKNTGKFTALTGALEAMLVDLVSRGALSNKRFEYITETLLPKSTDTQDMIRGKMEGLADILGLDKSALNLKEKSIKKEKQSLEDIFG